MTIRNTEARRGFTLAEVLVAIFVVGVGLIALLTLFPYGALKMSRAIQDERAAACANNAEARFTLWWQKQVWDNNGVRRTWAEVKTAVPSLANMENPTAAPANARGLDEESFPVLIDPYSSQDGTENTFVASATDTVPRVAPAAMSGGVAQIFRWTRLLDPIDFSQSGDGVQDGVTEVTRGEDSAYSWAWLIQKPAGAPWSEVNLKVLVFRGRLLGIPTTDTAFTAGVAFSQNATRVSLTGTPGIEPGEWIMDLSTDNTDPNNRIQRADFYRVVDVTTTGGTTVLEIDRPYPHPAPATPRLAVVGGMEGGNTLIEVFDKGRVTLNPAGVARR